MKALSLWLMLVPLFGQLEQSGEVLCRSRNGYSFQSRIALLDDRGFESAGLFALLSNGDKERGPDELWVTVCSDKDLYERLTTPQEIPLDTEQVPNEPIRSRPIAFLYAFGDSAFFEVWRSRSTPEWVVIRGENYFTHEFGPIKPFFLGQYIVPNPRRECDRTRRELDFVLPGLEQLSSEDLIPIFRYYQELFPEPAELQVTLYDSLATAASLSRRRLVSPHALAAGYGDRKNPSGKSVRYWKFWPPGDYADIWFRKGRETVKRSRVNLR